MRYSRATDRQLGTEHSALGYLHRFHVDMLKIDWSCRRGPSKAQEMAAELLRGVARR